MTRRLARLLVHLSALLLGLLCFSLLGCADSHLLELDAGQAKGLRLSDAWRTLARDGDVDGERVVLSSLKLDYYGTGVLRRALLQGRTDRSELLQVGYDGSSMSGDKQVQFRGFVSEPEPAGPTQDGGRRDLVAPILRAIDLVGPSSMIGLLEPAGNLGLYTIASTPDWVGVSLSPGAKAFRWDGTRFVKVATDDELRDALLGHRCLVGYSSKLVSSTSTDGLISNEYRGSAFVYFVIPTPGP